MPASLDQALGLPMNPLSATSPAANSQSLGAGGSKRASLVQLLSNSARTSRAKLVTEAGVPSVVGAADAQKPAPPTLNELQPSTAAATASLAQQRQVAMDATKNLLSTTSVYSLPHSPSKEIARKATEPAQDGAAQDPLLASVSFAAPVSALQPQSIDFQRIQDLFLSHHSASMYERHQAVLKKLVTVLQEYPQWLDQNLEPVRQVMALAFQKVGETNRNGGRNHGSQALQGSVFQLFDLVFHPVLEGEELDVFTREHVLAYTEYLNMFATVLDYEHAKLSEDLLESLMPMVEARVESSRPAVHQEHEDPDLLGLAHAPARSSPVPQVHIEQLHRVPNRFLKIMELSDFPGKVLSCFNDSTETNELQFQYLRLLRHLLDAEKCQQLMVESSFSQRLLQLMSQPTLTDPQRELCMETVWELVSHPQFSATVLSQITNFESIGHLQHAFLNFLQGSHRLACRQLRNDVCTLLNLMARQEDAGLVAVLSQADALNTLLFETMVMAEYKNAPGELQHVAPLTHSAEDLELKKSLMHYFAAVPNESVNAKFTYLRFLYEHLSFHPENEYIQGWSKRQLKSLQVQILGILHILLPPMLNVTPPSEHVLLIRFLQECLTHDTGILYDGANLDSEVEGLIPATLSVLLVLSEYSNEYKEIFAEAGIIQLMLTILAEKNHATKVHATSLLVCAAICRECRPHKAIFFKNDGVSALMPFLRFDSPEPEEKASVLLATLECIWEAVVGYPGNEQMFLERHGMFTLLDLLARSEEPEIQRHLLGTLLDLLENPSARAHILEWRTSKNAMKGVGSLLISLWNQEEKRLGGLPATHTAKVFQGMLVVITQAPYGMVTSSKLPLRGTKQFRQHPSITAEKSRAVAELDENLRAKIYGTICKLQMDAVEPLLDPEELIKLRSIQKYLDFKISEVWEEIADELSYEGVRPVTPDQECIRIAFEMTAKKVDDIREKQLELVRRKEQHERESEIAFYQLFLESKKNSGMLAEAKQQ